MKSSLPAILMIPLIERLCAVYTHFSEGFTSVTLLSEALTINNPGIIKPLFARVSLSVSAMKDFKWSPHYLKSSWCPFIEDLVLFTQILVRVSLLQTNCEALTINNPGIIKPLFARVSLSGSAMKDFKWSPHYLKSSGCPFIEDFVLFTRRLVRVSLLQTNCEALTINKPGIITLLLVRVSLLQPSWVKPSLLITPG